MHDFRTIPKNAIRTWNIWNVHFVYLFPLIIRCNSCSIDVFRVIFFLLVVRCSNVLFFRLLSILFLNCRNLWLLHMQNVSVVSVRYVSPSKFLPVQSNFMQIFHIDSDFDGAPDDIKRVNDLKRKCHAKKKNAF